MSSDDVVYEAYTRHRVRKKWDGSSSRNHRLVSFRLFVGDKVIYLQDCRSCPASTCVKVENALGMRGYVPKDNLTWSHLPFDCLFCPTSFDTYLDFLVHLIGRHFEQDLKKCLNPHMLKCPFVDCTYRADSFTQLILHYGGLPHGANKANAHSQVTWRQVVDKLEAAAASSRLAPGQGATELAEAKKDRDAFREKVQKLADKIKIKMKENADLIKERDDQAAQLGAATAEKVNVLQVNTELTRKVAEMEKANLDLKNNLEKTEQDRTREVRSLTAQRDAYKNQSQDMKSGFNKLNAGIIEERKKLDRLRKRNQELESPSGQQQQQQQDSLALKELEAKIKHLTAAHCEKLAATVAKFNTNLKEKNQEMANLKKELSSERDKFRGLEERVRSDKAEGLEKITRLETDLKRALEERNDPKKEESLKKIAHLENEIKMDNAAQQKQRENEKTRYQTLEKERDSLAERLKESSDEVRSLEEKVQSAQSELKVAQTKATETEAILVQKRLDIEGMEEDGQTLGKRLRDLEGVKAALETDKVELTAQVRRLELVLSLIHI